MDGIGGNGGTGGTETVPFDWLGDGLPILILLLAVIWILHRLRRRVASGGFVSRRRWRGLATWTGRDRSRA